jgi:hypothetical protein
MDKKNRLRPAPAPEKSSQSTPPVQYIASEDRVDSKAALLRILKMLAFKANQPRIRSVEEGNNKDE